MQPRIPTTHFIPDAKCFLNHLHLHIILAVKTHAVFFINFHFPHGNHEAQSDQMSYPRDFVAKPE